MPLQNVQSQIATAGVQTAPAITTVIADTGALLPGLYEVTVRLVCNDGTMRFADLQHRNSADSSTTQTWRMIGVQNYPDVVTMRAYRLAASERLRVIMQGSATAATSFQATIEYRRIGD